MELRHLRYFVAVAEELSFRRAAERLHLAQPPLSAQIKGLESELGVALLLRTTRSVRLTTAGEIFLEEAREVLAAATRARERAQKAGLGLIGTLRIGILASSATPRLAGILRSYREKYPGVELALHEMTSAMQLQQLVADELDVGFLREPVIHAELKTHFMEEHPMVLAMAAGHRLATRRGIQWADFHQEKLVLMNPRLQHNFYDNFISLCAKAGATPVVSQYANDIHSILWLISAGFGVAPTSKTMAAMTRPGLVFRDLPPGLPLVRLAFAWKGANSSPVLRSFLQAIGEAAGAAPASAPV